MLAHLRENMMARLGVTPDASTCQQMLSAYERYARDNKVLPIPKDYDHRKQLVLNTLHAGVREPFLVFLLLVLLLAPFYVAHRMKKASKYRPIR